LGCRSTRWWRQGRAPRNLHPVRIAGSFDTPVAISLALTIAFARRPCGRRQVEDEGELSGLKSSQTREFFFVARRIFRPPLFVFIPGPSSSPPPRHSTEWRHRPPFPASPVISAAASSSLDRPSPAVLVDEIAQKKYYYFLSSFRRISFI